MVSPAARSAGSAAHAAVNWPRTRRASTSGPNARDAAVTEPIRRRLDLKTERPAGGGDEFLTVLMVDDSHGDHPIASGLRTLPPPDAPLGASGLTVERFLDLWHRGERSLDEPARAYGRLLYDHLLRAPGELAEYWLRALDQA